MRKHKGIIITATILLAAIAVVAGNRFVKNQDNNEKNSRETEKVDVAEKKVEVKKETSLQKEATEISETTEITGCRKYRNTEDIGSPGRIRIRHAPDFGRGFLHFQNSG